MATTSTAQKCVHKGCGKVFTDPNAKDCVYHPGPPEFHEGQKGWKCCKPRVLTFDEFLNIPPCTTGKHSTVDDTPVEPKKETPDYSKIPSIKPISTSATQTPSSAATLSAANARVPLSQAQAAAPRSTTPQPQIEEDSDDPDASIPPNATCKRRACGKSQSSSVPREEEVCVYHPGVPLFHEGSKGWTCCKRRVLEFDEFMKIEGCKERKRHCYVGKKNKKKTMGADGTQQQGGDGGAADEEEDEELLEDVRNDFYQTPGTVIASFYLKKIDKERAKVVFSSDEGSGKGTADLDLPTADGKRYRKKFTLWGATKPGECTYKIMGTKLEMVLVKGDGSSWSVLRESDPDTGERIQVGRAGRA